MRRVLIGLAVTAALGAIAVLLWPEPRPGAVVGSSEPGTIEHRAVEPKPAAPEPQQRGHHLLAPPARARVAVTASDGGEGAARQAAVAPAAPAPSMTQSAPPGPEDKRGLTGARIAAEHESVAYATQTLHDDIKECLAEWRKIQPSAPGAVMLAFEIDRDGLQRSWLDYDGELPLGPASCFSNAVYGIDWSHIVDSPAKITMRFAARDGG
jgi:hypothetical protein